LVSYYLKVDMILKELFPNTLRYRQSSDSSPGTRRNQFICFPFPDPEFVNLFRNPGIDFQPGGLDSLKSIPEASLSFTNTGSVFNVLGRIGFNAGPDSDPAFYANADPDLDLDPEI
jgi:hypothetical protein